jgi:hypothetical protein
MLLWRGSMFRCVVCKALFFRKKRMVLKRNKGYGDEGVSDVDFFIKLIFFFYNICVL